MKKLQSHLPLTDKIQKSCPCRFCLCLSCLCEFTTLTNRKSITVRNFAGNFANVMPPLHKQKKEPFLMLKDYKNAMVKE